MYGVVQIELPIEMPISIPTSAKSLVVKEVHSEWIDKWIAERHYLGYCPWGARLRLAVYHDGQCVGGMLWGRPTAREYDQVRMLELTRMYLDDICPRNSESRCLALATKIIRKKFPEVHTLISYSDPAYGHTGTIYRAAGWQFDGITKGHPWNPRNGKPRRNVAIGPKIRWVKRLYNIENGA